MGWKENLLEASFRGVPFVVKSHGMNGGRRVVKHEFPMRDTPSTEDMGRKSNDFTIEAFIVGADYMEGRDALLEAIQEEGSAELVHPYLGSMEVNCEGFTLSESLDEGGIARFTLTFCEAGEAEEPEEGVDGEAVAEEAADEAADAITEDFASAFSIDGLPEFAIDDITSQFEAFSESIEGIAGVVNTIASGKVGMLSLISDFSDELPDLLELPGELAGAVLELVGSVTGIFEEPFEALKGLFGLFNFGTGETDVSTTPENPQTETRERQAENRDAITALVTRAAVIQAARIAPTATFETVEDARSVQESIVAQIDAISEDAETSDTVFSAMQKMRAAVVESVPPQSVALPNLIDFTPNATVPSLVLAYDLYENAAREAEIVTRNRVAYPGFVPGATPLKVVADA